VVAKTVVAKTVVKRFASFLGTSESGKLYEVFQLTFDIFLNVKL
jgi:hypothetical protein